MPAGFVPLMSLGRSVCWRALYAFVVASVTAACVTADRAIAEEASHCPVNADRRSSVLVRDRGYAEMPYMVRLPSGDIGMTLTVSSGTEGDNDQHIIFLVSKDEGKSWTQRSVIEPPSGPEASWAMPFVFEAKLFVVYLYNARGIKRWPLHGGGGRTRVDVIGDPAVRSSDDEGRSWASRTLVAVPLSDIDKRNGFLGSERILWLSGAPIIHDGYLYIGMSKAGVSRSGNVFPDTEAFLLRTRDPRNGTGWQLLPGNKKGFSAAGESNVTEEPNPIGLEANAMLVFSRTMEGRILQSITMDAGATWQSRWATLISGAPLPNPRANAPLFRFSDGRVIAWHHNNGAKNWWPRNPVYYSCLVRSSDGEIRWSEPRLLICDPRDKTLISYPSFLESGDRLLISETSKREVREHEFDSRMFCH